MLRPPSDAQYLIEACSTRPDFFYREHNAAIYVDGPPHDEPDQMREDEAITRRLMEIGYIVIRFHHKADWHDDLPSPSGHLRGTTHMSTATLSKPGTLIHARGREWVVLPESTTRCSCCPPGRRAGRGGHRHPARRRAGRVRDISDCPTRDDLGDFRLRPAPA